mmetsp:Transcript_91161/g.209001  ORF Transcript_91161/g.209001 Transcript_91161/m.209001 type:complete len:243 (+) Transcript_91161:53-781(+)
MSREKNVYLAKLSEQAERYDEMANYMKVVAEAGSELGVEERNLLSVAYKNAVGSRRAAWRILSSIEQTEQGKGNPQNAIATRDYRRQVEGELRELCESILQLLEGDLISTAGSVESKVFFCKMASDYYRYLSEISQGTERTTASEKARRFYDEATAAISAGLSPTDPIRLSWALSRAVWSYEILNQKEEAVRVARQAFEDAIAELDNVSEESYKDSTLMMQLLRDNLTLWTSEGEGEQRTLA